MKCCYLPDGSDDMALVVAIAVSLYSSPIHIRAFCTCMDSETRRACSRMTERAFTEAAVMAKRGRVLPFEQQTADHCV
jgi:hypothetical protein